MSWMSEIDASMRETGDIYAYEAARAAGDEREAERIMAHHRAIVAAGLLPVPAAASAGVVPLRFRRGWVAVALIVAAALSGLLGLGVAVAAATMAADPRGGLPACVTEDSSDCYWDADTRGNGEGRSFTDRGGVVTYWDGQP
jgi:hypothetical protein